MKDNGKMHAYMVIEMVQSYTTYEDMQKKHCNNTLTVLKIKDPNNSICMHEILLHVQNSQLLSTL